MKNKKYIAKSILWLLLWFYIVSIQTDAIMIFKIFKDFESICFLLFVAIMNYLSICSFLKNLNEYFWEKIKEENIND